MAVAAARCQVGEGVRDAVIALPVLYLGTITQDPIGTFA